VRSLLSRYRWSGIAVSPLLRAGKRRSWRSPICPIRFLMTCASGSWGGLELRPWSEQPPYEETPPGESWEAFCRRVTDVLNTILTQYDRPLIIAHSGVFRVLRRYALGTLWRPAG
jgi:probable phosphoglycerate mutase